MICIICDLSLTIYESDIVVFVVVMQSISPQSFSVVFFVKKMKENLFGYRKRDFFILNANILFCSSTHIEQARERRKYFTYACDSTWNIKLQWREGRERERECRILWKNVEATLSKIYDSILHILLRFTFIKKFSSSYRIVVWRNARS